MATVPPAPVLVLTLVFAFTAIVPAATLAKGTPGSTAPHDAKAGQGATGLPDTSLAGQGSVDQLAPHRATYDISLKRASDQSGVDNMSGRMVYEFNGSACGGYTTNFRFVTKIETGDQVSVTDQQIRTHEDLAAGRFDFETKSFTDDKLDKDVKGAAIGKPDGLRVELKQPQQKELDLANALFPTRHMLQLLDRARAGNRIFEARVFDGSEDGDKSYLTTTVLGGSATLKGDGKDPLVGQTYWPVSIAYFNDDKAGDQTPVYTQTFNLYESGITRDLSLDYGDVMLTGKLSKLEMLPRQDCAPRN